jgi:hypothetical protein
MHIEPNYNSQEITDYLKRVESEVISMAKSIGLMTKTEALANLETNSLAPEKRLRYKKAWDDYKKDFLAIGAKKGLIIKKSSSKVKS